MKLYVYPIIENPDRERKYVKWHYCARCGRTFTHWQAARDSLADKHLFECCTRNLVTLSTDVKAVYHVNEYY